MAGAEPVEAPVRGRFDRLSVRDALGLRNARNRHGGRFDWIGERGGVSRAVERFAWQSGRFSVAFGRWSRAAFPFGRAGGRAGTLRGTLLQTPAPMLRVARFAAVGLLVPLAPTVLAQPTYAPGAIRDSASAVGQGLIAYSDGNHAAAAARFREAVATDRRDVRARVLLARVLADTVLDRRDDARRVLRDARDVAPNDIEVLTSLIVLLRDDAPTFIQDRLREQQRLELSERILALDPTNAIAHEELGRAAVRDVWRYRGALAIADVPALRTTAALELRDVTASLDAEEEEQEDLASERPGVLAGEITAAAASDATARPDPRAIVRRDRWDLDRMRQQGVVMHDLSSRSDEALDVAARHFRAAIAADPFRREAYDDLMRAYALTGHWQEGANVAAEMYRVFPEDVGMWRYLGLARLRVGDAEGAERAFRSAERFAPPDERAAFASIDLLVRDDERAAYREDREGFTQRFWTSQDPRLLTTYNERRLEHLARMTYADLVLAAPAVGKRGWETQRGRMFVRYGPPEVDHMIFPPVERDDFTLVNLWQYADGLRLVFEDPMRNGEFSFYSPGALESGQALDPWQSDYALRAREAIAAEPQRYAYADPAGARRVQLPYRVTTFRNADGRRTDLYVHYGVPIGEVDAASEQVDVTAHTGTFLVGRDRSVLHEQRQTLHGLRTAQIVHYEEANLWVETQPITAPPGEAELSVEFQTASGGVVAAQRRPVTLPDYADDANAHFAMSDLMLAFRAERVADGRIVEQGDILRNGRSLRPAPWSVFRRDQKMVLYFELYDLAIDANGRTDYEVELTMAPKVRERSLLDRILPGRRRRDEVSVRFPGAGTARSQDFATNLDTSDKRPGLYTLTLKVEDKAGRHSETRTVDVYLE